MGMAATPVIRNVALVGHSGVGKTMLAEALLHRAGVVQRLGSIEDGTTVCDTEPEEIKRGISLSPAIAPFEWKAPDGQTYTINLIDAPGYADFAGGMDQALAVADLAVVVVSAVDGVEVGTEIAWQQCADAGIPRMVFFTKEDKQHADFHRVLEQLGELVGSGLVPLELPIGEEEAFHGVADVLSDTGFDYDADGTHHTAADARRRRRRGGRAARAGRRGDRLRRRRAARALPVRRAGRGGRARARPGARGARLPGVPRAGGLRGDRGRHRPARRLHLRARRPRPPTATPP